MTFGPDRAATCRRGARNKVRAAYNRATQLAEWTRMMQAPMGYLENLLGGSSADQGSHIYTNDATQFPMT
jgi:hypothetical protein